MSKTKNQQLKANTKLASQLPIEFKPKNDTYMPIPTSAKVVSIKAITDQKKMNLIMDIIKNTKSF